MAVRFCSQCQQPMQEGYLFEEALVYCCSDECLQKEAPELTEELKQQWYEEDILYWTDWYDVDPGYTLFKAYSICDTLYSYENDANYQKFFKAPISEPVRLVWLLMTNEEEEALYKVTKEVNNTRYLELKHGPFTHQDTRTFHTLELAKQAYLEEEENI